MESSMRLGNMKPLADPDLLKDLIRGCIVSDRTAQRRLYDIYSPWLYAVIRRYYQNGADADHILNESFFKIFTHISKYEFSGSFEGWIKRITVNTLTDYYRSQSRKRVTDLPEQFADSTENSFKIASNLDYKQLLNLIHELPETQRTVFNLFVFEDMAHKDIGELISISENNSRWYLNDARKRLKNRIMKQ